MNYIFVIILVVWSVAFTFSKEQQNQRTNQLALFLKVLLEFVFAYEQKTECMYSSRLEGVKICIPSTFTTTKPPV